MAPVIFPSFPAWLLISGAAFELFRIVALRTTLRRYQPILTFTAWAVRPWTFWACFNLVFRWRREQGFNNLRTFPFFANLWNESESFTEAVSRIVHAPGVPVWGWVVAAFLLAMVLLLVWVVRRNPTRLWPAVASLYMLSVGLHLSTACLPDGAWTEQGRRSSLLSSWQAHSTMLYTLLHIRSTDDYLSRFLQIQPRLRATIHGLSHPPGASLSLYWIGQALGVKGKDIRQPEVRLRYAIGLTAFGALNVIILFLLGRSLFDPRTGFLAATLWAAAPSVSAYATFAQDALYAVFFNLALWLAWHTVTSERRTRLWALVLGADFFAMTLLNYSWCIMTAIFAVFALVTGWRQRWRLADYVVRGGVPLAVMALLSAGFLAYYRLDYLAMYKFSSQYVKLWYPFTGTYQWVMALVGGQIDLFLLLGSVTCSAFAVALARLRNAQFSEPRVIYLAVLLSVFALPLLFGPTCLKMETARCWNWVASLPIAFAAARLLDMPHRVFVYGAPVVSILTYTAMRLFLNFAP